ncbi:hypothetical protein BGX28_003385 [Mortierella sp. GBA30]|nr:hypothetical protein BGX28_003385 [Mortierella sp. GBA30]
MLGNGYKERLSNAQSSLGSLLLNLAKQPLNTTLPSESQQQKSDDNEPVQELSTPFNKHSLLTRTINSNPNGSSPSVQPVLAPVLESNSASRYLAPVQEQRQQQRTSRLPNAGYNVARVRDQYPKLSSSESSESIKRSHNAFKSSRSSMDEYSLTAAGFFPPSLSGSRCWGRPLSFQDSNRDSYTSNSTGTEINAASNATSTKTGIENLFEIAKTGERNHNRNNSRPPVPVMDGSEYGIDDGGCTYSGEKPSNLQAALTIQRAVRRFLARKHIRDPRHLCSPTPIKLEHHQHEDTLAGSFSNFKETAAAADNDPSLDLEALQQKCLRQATQIKQLKELMTKMMLEAEEDRHKLRQRDREIEELTKQQRAMAISVSSSRFANANTFRQGNGVLATSTTVPSFNTFGLAGMALSSGDDSFSSSTANGSPAMPERLVGSALSVSIDDACESHISYNSANVASAPHTMSSRSNSIAALQSQSSHPSLGLKINTSISQPLHNSQQAFYSQHYHGLQDMVDSPTSSDFTQDGVATPSSYGSGRGLTGSQHGYNSHTGFPLLNHRTSNSFSSPSRAFDSPSLEQQSPYPWNLPTGLSHSQSWADDVNAGYVYDTNAQTSGQFQHGGIGHPVGYDPQFINQQYSHAGSQQQQQSPHHQGMSPYRNSYRRHSEKPTHLDYQMCVDRILQATDQQASIHLQQKLKTSPPEQKLQIIDAILGQAYPLMSNRFGNFLIQRCFEFGSPQQIDALAQAMRGNILTLACDPFGCHVVQKALDNVEEDCKARIVTEMFRRIRETIVHRYACHVWQKVFEIRWTDAPPAVMTYVNNAVAGRWASVAVDETGSLVVQNVFENCAVQDKRPVLNEILQSVTTIAKGQWGNWVIQHILEHGAPADRATVTQKILEDAVSLSLDQYASKVVEKTLRMASTFSSAVTATSLVAAVVNRVGADQTDGTSSDNNNSENDYGGDASAPTVTVHGKTISLTQEEVMGQYISIICDGVQDRPRIPLIDIAADQYGNYIVQYILTNAGTRHRETCAALIKRHMVSLRGSKYGQKVAFMVERWRGSPFSGNHNNSSSSSHGGTGGAPGHGNGPSSNGSHTYGSKTIGSSIDGGNGSGSGRRRW